MPSFINLSCYHFLSLENLPELRAQLQKLCHELALKGTILLAPEGINFFVAGTREGIDCFMTELRKILSLPNLTAKESEEFGAAFQTDAR